MLPSNKDYSYVIKIIDCMKQLGPKALQKIENLITAKQPKQDRSPKKNKSAANFRASKIVDGSMTKAPVIQPVKSPQKVVTHSPSKGTVPRVYIARQREKKMLQKKTRIMYNELEERVKYRVQNTHSFFLNQRNPKPPIYQRAQDIMKQREAYLQEKRQEKLRQKQQADERQYEQFLKMQMDKRVFSKEEAYSISDRLYKDYYLKTHRLNQQKIEHYMEQSKFYRVKPIISPASQQLYQMVAEKSRLQTDIIDRFGQYDVQRAQKTKQTINEYKIKYTPFKPSISDRSRVLISSRDEQSQQLLRSNHCLSCNFLKTNTKNTSPMRTPEQAGMGMTRKGDNIW